MTSQPKQQTNSNAKVIGRLMLVVIGMFGFGFVMVPIYDIFCEVTGLNGKTSGKRLTEVLEVDTNREVVVEFVATLNEEMPWEFRPAVDKVTVNPGQPTRITYVAKNVTNKDIIGQAVPSVAPGKAATYFQKTECFCFTEQKLEAGEEKEMPVIFVVDPDLPDDVTQLALSYTFFIKPTEASKTASLAHN